MSSVLDRIVERTRERLRSEPMDDGMRLAKEAIASGAARAKLQQLAAASHEVAR